MTITSGQVVHSSSTFEEIYDVQHFITTLSRDVEIIRQLPRQYAYLMEDDRQKTKVRDRRTGPGRVSFFTELEDGNPRFPLGPVPRAATACMSLLKECDVLACILVKSFESRKQL